MNARCSWLPAGVSSLLVAVGCARSAHSVAPAATSDAQPTPHPFAGASAAQAKPAAVWWRPEAVVGCEARLVALEPEYHWDFGSPGDPVHGWGTYAFASFVMVAPARHAGREFNVVFTCETEDRLSPRLSEGIGHVYSFELPEDFLAGTYSTIDDCSFVPGVSWVCPNHEPSCPPPDSPP